MGKSKKVQGRTQPQGTPQGTPQGLPPLKPGERYVTGSEQFAEQLARIPRGKTLDPIELKEHFSKLFEELEEIWKKEERDTPEKRKAGSMKRAEKLSENHPIPAFGYPMTYIRVVSGEVTREQFEMALHD